MTQFYFDPEREHEPHSLPDAEVFYVSETEAEYNRQNSDHGDEYTCYQAGWYYWACFPGCLPDGDPIGPFDSESEAMADAQGA